MSLNVFDPDFAKYRAFVWLIENSAVSEEEKNPDKNNKRIKKMSWPSNSCQFLLQPCICGKLENRSI